MTVAAAADPSIDSIDRPGDRTVRTVFLGSGRFAQPILGRLADHPSIDIVGVVTAPPRPVGRRQVETPTPVDTQARKLGLPVLTPGRLRDPAALASVLELAPELVVLADYGQLVPRALLDLPHGALNLHPSLLPRHRGAAPIPAAILAGDPESGVTLMRMDAGLDTGPIVAVERTAIAGDETAPALEARLAIAAASLLGRSLDPWLAGELETAPQGVDGATLTRPLRRADGRIDPRLPAIRLERQIRAFDPWPGSFLLSDGDRLAVLAAVVSDPDPADEPGRLVADPAGLALTTTDGRLVLLTVQPAGGQPMSGEDYLRGRPAILGRRIDPPAVDATAPLWVPVEARSGSTATTTRSSETPAPPSATPGSPGRSAGHA
ncbi:MAG TPA: methionyl-tRNA formyltransferase [Candidatus Limnocylindrales bacterium]|nr:methionyl-tRNA formyltransferase [Candidatus Limnocylindrales bacterium]